jgi:hypothetical protein
LLRGSLIRWLAIFIPPTFGTSPATKSQWWIQIVRQDAQLKEDYFMADDMEKNRQQGGQSGQSGQQSGQSGQSGQKGGQTGQSQQGQSGQQNQEKKGGGQGQNEDDDKAGQRRAS